MKTKRYLKSMVLALAVSGMCLQTLAGAQENAQVESTYSNAAEAEQAAHIARREANTTDPSLQAALSQLNEAENQMGRMQMSSNNQHQMMSAETTLNHAEDKYVGMLSKMTGVSAKDISDMHTAGVAWGDVANELGMHVSTNQMANSAQGRMGTGQMTGTNSQGAMQQGNMTNGQMATGSQASMGTGQMGKGDQVSMGAGQMSNGNQGSMMGSRSAEIMAATARNTQSGWGTGHGTGMHTGTNNSNSGGMVSGAGGMSNGMGDSGSGGMGGSGSGGMGGSGSSGMGGSGSGGMGGSGSGGMGGGSGSGGSGSGGSGGGSGGSGGGSGGSGGGGGMH